MGSREPTGEENWAGGPPPERLRVLVVTGMSGAGKTQALKALEDIGFEAIDNVPLSLLENLVGQPHGARLPPGGRRPLAIGVDIRTRDFGVESFHGAMDRLRRHAEADVDLLFMDCEDEELRRRYAETRHRHPLALDRPVADGIAHERRLLGLVRDRADLVLDTTGQSPGALKSLLQGQYGAGPGAADLSVFVTSFSYRRGLPREADLVFDVRFLANPHYDPALRPLTGREAAVGAHVSRDPAFEPFFDGLTRLLAPLLPRYAAEGKSYLTIAVGCTGGRHRSVFIAERLAAWIEANGQRVHLHHRELDRAGP